VIATVDGLRISFQAAGVTVVFQETWFCTALNCSSASFPTPKPEASRRRCLSELTCFVEGFALIFVPIFAGCTRLLLWRLKEEDSWQ